MIYDYLSSGEDNEKYRYAMVGYMLSNTLTENGYVSRGICDTDENQCLTGITERTHIEKTKDGAAFTEDDGKTWVPVALDTTVSMNLFGFTASMLKELESTFTSAFPSPIRSPTTAGRKYSHFIGFFSRFSVKNAENLLSSSFNILAVNPNRFMETGSSGSVWR